MDKEAPMKTVEEFIKDFEYDSNELYEALSVSTDEYVYVCDMRRRTIRYPADMVEEFGLPGEIVQDPLPCWKDVGRILRTFKIKKNVEVTDNGKIII